MKMKVNVYYALVQCSYWMGYAAGMVVYVNELVEENDKAQGQAFAGMTLTFGNVFAALFGGILIEAKGVNYMLVFGT